MKTKTIEMQVAITVDESVDAEDLVLCVGCELDDDQERIIKHQIIGFECAADNLFVTGL